MLTNGLFVPARSVPNKIFDTATTLHLESRFYSISSAGDDPCKDVQCSRPYAKCRVINNTPQCQCQQICTREYAPVCGNDGKTYGNLCMMTSKACSQNQTIIVAGRGKCGEFKTNFELSRLNGPFTCFLRTLKT